MSTATQSIREIINANPSAATVFERFEIDVRTQADSTLDRACAALQLSTDQVIEKLESVQTQEGAGAPAEPSALSVTRLIQHIVRVHHRAIRQDLPQMAELARQIANKSGEGARLERIASLIEDVRRELSAHIAKEEMVLFPFIAQMDEESLVAYPQDHPCFRSVTHPVFVMAQEHEAVEHLMAELRSATNEFEAAEDGADAEALMQGLRNFEAGLRQHVHLENDLLFPRAIEMETALKAGK